MVDTMQAAVVRATMDFGVESVPVPATPSGGLLLRVKSAPGLLPASTLRFVRLGANHE